MDYLESLRVGQLKKQIAFTEQFAKGDVDFMVSEMKKLTRNTLDFDSKPKGLSFLTKIVLQEYINGVSALPVKRTLYGKGKVDLGIFVKNLDLFKLQSLTEVAGTVAVRPIVDEGEIHFICYTADQLAVKTTESGRLVELQIQIDEETIEVWDAEKVTTLRHKREEEVKENPFGVIPFAFFRANRIADEFFGFSDLWSVANNNNSLNALYTNLLYLVEEQAWGYLVAEGGLPPQDDSPLESPEPGWNNLKISPEGVVFTDEGVKLKFLTPDAKIREALSVLEELEMKFKADAFVLDVEKDGTYNTGLALQQRRGGYLRFMNFKRLLYAEADARLIELAFLVYDVAKTGEPRRLNPDLKVRTEFDSRSLRPLSADEEARKRESLLKMNVTNPVSIIMEEYGVSRSEALKMYRENKKLNKRNEEPKDEQIEEGE